MYSDEPSHQDAFTKTFKEYRQLKSLSSASAELLNFQQLDHIQASLEAGRLKVDRRVKPSPFTTDRFF